MDLLGEEVVQSISKIKEMDFRRSDTTNFINYLISFRTNGNHRQFYEKKLLTNTMAILTSTPYFKASWQGKFDLIPKGSPEDNRVCFASTTQDLINSICQDVQWMTKEGLMGYTQLQNRRTNIRAEIIDIPFMTASNNIDGQDHHQVHISDYDRGTL